jgi:uncharacterized protein (TIGR00251 family)
MALASGDGMNSWNGERGTRNFLSPTEKGVRLVVHIQPRASRNEVVGLYAEGLKLRIAAPPVEGAANQELVRFVARLLDRPRSAVRLISGAGSRRKVLEIGGLQVPEAARKLGLGATGAP